MSTSNDFTALVDRVRLAGGVVPADRELITETFSPLFHRLSHLEPDLVEMELRIKNRDGNGQKVTLEARIDRLATLVATSTHEDLRAALNEVSAEIVNQYTKANDKRGDHSHHRSTIRGN